MTEKAALLVLGGVSTDYEIFKASNGALMTRHTPPVLCASVSARSTVEEGCSDPRQIARHVLRGRLGSQRIAREPPGKLPNKVGVGPRPWPLSLPWGGSLAKNFEKDRGCYFSLALPFVGPVDRMSVGVDGRQKFHRNSPSPF